MNTRWRIDVRVTGLVFVLGASSSWGDPPPNPTPSDSRGNTAGGSGALSRLTSGSSNTAFGAAALYSHRTGSWNTATGFQALFSNTTGHENTAGGFNALESNTTGSYNTASGAEALGGNTTGIYNTASGAGALFSNSAGSRNTAVGAEVLRSNITGYDNTASGFHALNSNTIGFGNTAHGVNALDANTRGQDNTASGAFALGSNTTGHENTASGFQALVTNTTGYHNTASGFSALVNCTTGTNNIALGYYAGMNLTTGSFNIYIGSPGGTERESQTVRLGNTQTRAYMAGIAGAGVNGSPVLISRQGQLGILRSSARYKREIEDMGSRSDGLFKLRPVTFRFKDDPEGQRQYGLIAEEIAKIYPELVIRNEDGTVETVQYYELVPMLLNELQRQQQTLHTQAQQLEALQAENRDLQAALAQQNVAFASRLTKLEVAARAAAKLANR